MSVDSKDDDVPVIISVRFPFAGAQRVSCDYCKKFVFEDPRNLQRVKEQNGFVICDLCAIRLKLQFPQWEYGGQMWEGKIRETQAVPGWEKFIEFMKKTK